MQNKGLITAFAIALGLASLYQLSFTWVANNVESDAEAFSAVDTTRSKSAYLDSMMSQEVYPVLGYTYAQVKDWEMNLGLDLKGGMNVILEVSVKDILKGQVGNVEDPVFQQLLESTDAQMSKGNADYLETFKTEIAEFNGEVSLSERNLFGSYGDDGVYSASDSRQEKNDKIIAALERDVEAAIANVFTVLRARIDQFGTTQPNIQRLEEGSRILVELPGVKDPSRVKKLLQSTAELQFWNMYEAAEVYPFLLAADAKLSESLKREQLASVYDASEVDSIESIENDTSYVANTLSDSLSENSPLKRLLHYDNQDGLLGGTRIGWASISDTSKVNELLSRPEISQLLNRELRWVKFLWNNKPEQGTDQLILFAIKGNRDNAPELDGSDITDARHEYDDRNQNLVSMTMNVSGAQVWKRLTAEAAAQVPKRSVAVVLDNYVYSNPVVQSEISGGRTQITGNFSLTEAKDLANILRAGKLDAPAKIIQADVIGPSLGKESISASINSFLIALSLVLIYMFFYYSRAGLAANLALLLNMFFIFGILASFRAVLTLPGMAGIVLTIGMAVDANVIIFERIREELRLGKGLKAAILDGYKNSNSAIVDANATTLIVGIILFTFGTGPIRGFATTLIIGILTSLFSALFISRLVFERRLARKKNISFASKLTANWYTKINFDFLRRRKIAYVFSALVISVGLFSLFTKGLNLGVDFVGGKSYQVRFDQPVEVGELTASLSDQFVDADGNKFTPVVKTFGDANQVIITTNYTGGESGLEEGEMELKLYNGLKGFFEEELETITEFVNYDNEVAVGLIASREVGPTIADDIKTGAFYSVIFSLIVVFLYILGRFRKWQFSLGAVTALVHDVLFVMGVFSLLDGILPFQLEVDQAFIAAILTVIGYSLNDTVVVFDRIRENLGARKANFAEGVNKSLNQTLSRTFNTSLTTLFVLLIIFLFGGEVIRGFMFALLLGVLVGTYSSLFIATPIMYDATKKNKN